MSSQKRNDPLKIESGGVELGLRAAIEYSPYVLCPGCHQAIRERNMIGEFCEVCQYKKEVDGEGEKLKTEGSPAPGDGDGGLKPKGREGQQLSLLI